MESATLQTADCLLDDDLLKSWDELNLESFHNSDNSESSNKETITQEDKWIEQLKNLSLNDLSDSKYKPSECSNKITKINVQNKNVFEKLNFTNNKENQSSFLHISKELLKVDVKYTSSSHSNKKCEFNFQKKDDTEKPIFEDNTENDKKQCSSLSNQKNKLLNNSLKIGSDTSAEYDSDDDNEAEEVILRERYPQRHNRSENNRKSRTSPFPQNYTTFYKEHLNLENSETSVNINPLLSEFDVFYDDNDSLNNITSTNHEKYVSPPIRTFNSCSSNSESAFDVGFKNIILSAATDKLYNDVVPCDLTNQIASGVIPFTSIDEMFDSVVPSVVDIGHVSDAFSAEINNISYFDSLKDDLFFKSNNSDFISSNVTMKALLNSQFEDLPAEEVEQILKNLKEPKPDSYSRQNCEDTSKESSLQELSCKEVDSVLNNSLTFNQNNDVSSCEEVSYPKSNHYKFDSESYPVQSFVSIENAEETSLYFDLPNINNISELSGEFYNTSVNLPEKYSNLASENVTSINRESLSHKTSDFINISEEIDHKIEEWSMNGNNISKPSYPVSEVSWNMLPFFELNDVSVSEISPNNECINTSSIKMSSKKNVSKCKHLKQNNKSLCKVEQPKICWKLGTAARDKLFESPSFCIREWEFENQEMKQQIERGMLGTEKKKIIHYYKNRKTKYKGTNLHRAILSGNIEKVYCIVEWHKECHETITEINLRDSFNKTVLDYSKKLGLDLLTDYLSENNAKESVNV